MKKIILSVAVLASTFAMAQTGKVGVNTTTPVRTLDVEGDLRVKTLGDGTAAAYSNILVQNPATGLVDALPISGIKDGSGNEPWYNQAGNIAATANTQNIYQMGKVTVGANSTFPNAQMSIYGPGTKGAAFGAQLVLADTGSTNPILGFNVNGVYANYIGVDRTSAKLYITAANGNATLNALTNAAFVLDAAGKISLGFGNQTPTETLDVNGNARIRGLVDGSDVTNFPFTVVAKADGTLGKNDGQLVPLVNSVTTPTDDNSPAMFVHKYYSSTDYLGGRNASTGMSDAKWDAFLTVTKMERKSGSASAFMGSDGSGAMYTLQLYKNGGFWKVTGDIKDINEYFEYEILFIKKSAVAVDNTRTAL